MASEAQIAANRRNAERSTGPRSEAGKARVAQNGLKHGLCSRRVVLAGEDEAEFQALLDDLTARFRPEGETELALLREYAAASWRLDRIPALEAGLLEGAWPEGEAPEGLPPDAWGLGEAFLARSREILRLSLHESRLSRQRERARKELVALQAARRQAAAELALDSRNDAGPTRRPAPAAPLQRADAAPEAPPRPQMEQEATADQLAKELALLRRKAA